MVVITCGGRGFDDWALVHATMVRYKSGTIPTDLLVVIHGAARGADTYVANWCTLNGVEQWTFPANWTRFGGAAGPIRNARMLDVGLHFGIERVIAFPGGWGTADMVRRATEAGVRVDCIEQDKQAI